MIDGGEYRATFAMEKSWLALRELRPGEFRAYVELAKLTAIQETISRAKAINFLTVTTAPYPLVTMMRNRLYIHDGHHRLTAEWARGVEVVYVRLLVLPEIGGRLDHDGQATSPTGD